MADPRSEFLQVIWQAIDCELVHLRIPADRPLA